MSKYIDADKLKERVTRLIASARQNDWPIAEDYLRRVIDIIDSLQQEPRFPQYDNIIDKVFGAGNLEGFEYHEAEMLVALAKEELLKSLQQEQPEVEFEDKFAKFLERKDAELGANSWSEEDLRELAIYFYYSKNNDKQPDFNLVEEITDKSRSCYNCVNGISKYPNCYCWQHKDCNTDEPYKIPKEDWVETAKTCKEFESELGLNARKEE